MNLPPDIFTELFKYTLYRDYPSLRRVNKSSRQALLDLDICCKLPSTYEIVDWLWNQSQLLKSRNTAEYSIIDSTRASPTQVTDVLFTFRNTKSSLSDNHILLDTKTGEFILQSRQAILDFIQNLYLIIKYSPNTKIGNLDMIRNILSQRPNCASLGVSSEACFAQILEHYEPMYLFDHDKANYK